jgi:hypothetical protein
MVIQNSLGHVYANALDTASEHLRWAMAAQEGRTAIGLDISNHYHQRQHANG